uniref:Uncharacterized protein n=1 Tax=viral metagenome TaxID=1070528 RepID=A0A6M3KZE7_9ZZZZ
MPKGIKGFQQGHKLATGRPKKKSTIYKEFIKKHPMAYEEMLELLYNLAMNKTDREAAQYICDRLKGRPKQAIETTGEIKLDPGKLLIAIQALRLDNPNVLQLEQGEDDV